MRLWKELLAVREMHGLLLTGLEPPTERTRKTKALDSKK